MKGIIIQVTLLLLGAHLHAQQPFSNTGNLQIHTGGSLTGFGNFSNASTGILVNNGSFYMRGDLTNAQSSMAAGTGTLYLNGIAAQSINGTQPFRTFNLVTDNNTVAGITLNNNLSVSGVHTYTDGIITTSATPNYLIYEAGSSYSGDGDGQHVNGWVKKLGSTNFSFPVGNGTVIRKAAIESLSGSLEFNARYRAPNSTYLSVQLPLLLVDPNEYWNINRVDASGSAQVHLNWDNSKVAFPSYVLNAIRAGYYTGGLWTDRGGSATGNITTTGDITSNTVSAFGDFTFASMEFMIPLQFLGITAQRKVGYNLVEWRTADAWNTDHFEIERSEDGLHFEKIGTTVSYNSPSILSYSFKDAQLVTGTLWYRVRSVDIDGKFKLSGVVSVKNIAQGNPHMYVLNNPAHGSIQLYAPDAYKGECDYYLNSASGQLIQKGTITVTGAGSISIKLDAGISHGVYFLHVKNDKQQFRERILVR
jgi:hypothetical protein